MIPPSGPGVPRRCCPSVPQEIRKQVILDPLSESIRLLKVQSYHFFTVGSRQSVTSFSCSLPGPSLLLGN